MANASQSNKTRSAGRSASAAKRGAPRADAIKEEPRLRSPQRVGQAGKDAEQHLHAGIQRLTEAISKFASASHRGGANTTGLREAYASIVSLLPKRRRLALLETMRNSIDAVAREEGGADAPARGKHVSTADFMISLQEQERAQRMRDIATQRLLPAAQMRERMQLSPQALSAALKTKRIFALSGPSDEYVYPAFFADPSYERRALERVSQALGDLPGSSKWDFFTKPLLSLGGKTPLQAIAKGRVEAVMNLAKVFREQ